MEKYVSPDIQVMKRDFDEFLAESENFVKNQKEHGYQK